MNDAQTGTIVKKQSMKEYLSSPAIRTRINDLLKDRAPQFIVTISSMVSNDAKLASCEPASLFVAALTITALDLPMNNNLGFAWIIPYKQKDGTFLAQAQLGYKAFIQLAMRSNQFKTLNVSEVKQGECKGINRLSGELELEWNNDSEKRNKLPTMGFVAYMRLLNGFEKSLYMTVQEAKDHGLKYSQNYKKYNSGLWAEDFDAMAKKTVLKLLLSKYAPMSTDMAKAQEIDQAVIVDDKVKYLDNHKQTPAEISEEKERQRLIKYIAGCKTVADLEKCKTSCVTNELAELYQEKEKTLIVSTSEPKTPAGKENV